MSTLTNKKIQSINRNLSVDRERVSNACIIGLYVCLGHSVTVKLPSKRSKHTLAHLSISSTEINGEEINNVIQRQFHFPQILDKNKRRDKEVAIFNTLSKEVTGNYFKLAKRTTAVKTLKLKIYKEIGFLNKNGVNEFGVLVTQIVMKRNPCGKCSSKAFVMLKEFDEEIVNALKSVLEKKENVNEFYFGEYSNLYKRILKCEVEESLSGKDVISDESWRSVREYSPIHFGERSAFTFVDSHLYSTECADWFY